jgi:hypothetical protein
MPKKTPEYRRPGQPNYVTTTPSADMMLHLLGGITSGAVALTSDDMAAIQRLYGFTLEPSNQRPDPPVEPTPPPPGDYQADMNHRVLMRQYQCALDAWTNWQDPNKLLKAGAERNALRFAETDGLRLLAWIARHCPAGEDPLKVLVQLAVDAGWDVGDDAEWAEQEDDSDTSTECSSADVSG